MGKKNIALILYRYFPYGGLQKDFLSISKELFLRGHLIRVFTRKWDGDIPNWLEVIEIGEKGLTNYAKNKIFVSKVFSEVKAFNPDLIFGFNKMPGLDLYFAADTCFAKHSSKKHFLQKFTRRFKQSMRFEADVFAENSKTKILLLNTIQQNDFHEFYSTSENRMQIIPPGISQDWVEATSLDLHKDLNISKTDKIILFVGSDFYRKGLDRAIEGLDHLRKKKISSTLVVVGDDDVKPFSGLIKKKGIKNKIRFLGPRHDVASLMKSADLLIHPAREEAAGNIIIEAMVSGLPSIVSSEVGFSKEVLKFNSGSVLRGNFSQNAFNSLLEETISEENLTKIRLFISSLKNDDYFYSRFKFVVDYIENNF